MSRPRCCRGHAAFDGAPALPRACTRVRGVGGHAERASARARFVARRAGRWGLLLAKVTLWLVVVTASLLAIVLMAARGAPSVREAAAARARQSAADRHRELERRAIAIDRVGVDERQRQ